MAGIDVRCNNRQSARREGFMQRSHARTPIGRRICIVVAMSVCALVSTAALPAGARVLDRQRYFDSFTTHEVNCGYRLRLDLTMRGVMMLKTSAHDGPTRLFDNYDIHEVFTQPDGDGYILDQEGLYNDVQVRHARGTLYRYTAINAGQVFTIRTLDGKAVYRNRGVFQITFLVDTLGDDDFSNDVFLEETTRLVKDAGQHPILTDTEDEFCSVIDGALQN